VAEHILAYTVQSTVMSLYPSGKQNILTLRMSMLNRMLLIEKLHLKFCIINGRSHQWVCEINTERDIYGELYHLYSELRGYHQRFFEYTEMSVSGFKPISPTEQFIVTLR
jgi:hypothetical protein